MNEPLSIENRDKILSMLPEGLDIAQRTLGWFKRSLSQYRDEADVFANFPSMFLGTVDAKGMLEHYDGFLRLIDEHGEIVEDMIPPHRYQELIAETVEPYSFMKFAYYRKKGYPDGIYRVGPLARLNLITACGTPRADEELAEFRKLQRGPVLSSFHYHDARLIEIIYGLEKMQQLLNDPKILDTFVRAGSPEPARGHRCRRSAPRHADSPLPHR